jgi:Zn finger protein HypA/HybF involved in hydrogenase expression
MKQEKPIANLDWSLYVYCPKCEQDNDLARARHDRENDIAKHIFSNDWDKLNDWEVTCEHCSHEFKIEKVEY